MRPEEAIKLVEKEYDRAVSLHPPFNSPHEGYAVIKEELDELWEEIRKLKSIHGRNKPMMKEAIQLTAMGLRFIVDFGSGVL